MRTAIYAVLLFTETSPIDRSATTRHRKSSLSHNYPSLRLQRRVIEYVYREVHWPWSAANRLIAAE